jgi:hypothetical protein
VGKRDEGGRRVREEGDCLVPILFRSDY